MTMAPPWTRPSRLAAVAGALLLVAAGWLVADTLTRPMDVHLRTTIEVWRADEDGTWKRIDRVGPENVRFDASLLEMAGGEKIASEYVLRTTSKEGLDYTVRLADDADIDFNPATGRFDADLVFDVTYGGGSARVVARPSTETRFGPSGPLRGRRAEGILGRGPATFTLVSVNEMAVPGEAPMTLVTEETYRMVPRGRGGRGR